MQKVALAYLALVATLSIIARLIPLPDTLYLSGSTTILDQDGTPLHVFLAPDQRWRIPTRPEDVDPDYLAALFALEDARFSVHTGTDPLSIARAALTNTLAGHTVSGASTLTMQLIRMLEPRPRTLRSKAIEALRALQIEARLDKTSVLEAYLSHLPFGKNVEGLEAASLWYFGHTAKDLSDAEIAILLAVPQDPNHRYPAPTHTHALEAARDTVVTRLQGKLKPESDILPNQIRPIPRLAPHAASWVRNQDPRPTRIPTTLDNGLQSRTEAILARNQDHLAQDGIYNIAVVVLDKKTAQIRALVGGHDFWDKNHGGQIIAFDEPRSPGSTLKPLVYAAAIDQGIALPDFLIPDAPVSFQGYTPQNYDGDWSGMVTLQEALSRSLNIPFIHLLSQLGVEPFLAILRQGGARHLNPTPGHYGLSLVAGGIELSPLEIAGLYRALAVDGMYRKPTWRPEETPTEVRLFSEGATWLTRRALRLRERPDFPSRGTVGFPSGIFWKTGTSFGNRDAWAVGGGEKYVVAVWLGNLDNTSSSHLIGAEAAAPILFDLLDAFDDRLESSDPQPAELRPIEVCALSGHPASDACTERRYTLAREHRVPTDRCPLHQQVFLDDHGLRTLPGCNAPATRESRVFWPPTVRRWLGSRYRAEAEAPPWAEGCNPQPGTPKIESPEAGQTILLLPGVASTDQEIPLDANGGTPPYTWFIDGRFLETTPERAWWPPTPGEHQVLVQDGGGGSDQRTILVRTQ